MSWEKNNILVKNHTVASVKLLPSQACFFVPLFMGMQAHLQEVIV